MLFTCKHFIFSYFTWKKDFLYEMEGVVVGGGGGMALPLPLSPAVQDPLSAPTLAPPHSIGPVLFWHFWPSFYPI